MRNRSLHQRLRAFAEEAAFQLCADAETADDMPFEVVAAPGARTPLYCYRPLTGEFIREREPALATLPTCRPAVAALAGLGGIEDYLRLRGESRVPADREERGDLALRAFLDAIYQDRTDFEFVEDRFDRAYEELERTVYERRALTAVIAPLHGLALCSEEVPLDDDLSLVSGDSLDGLPPEAVWSGPTAREEPNVIALLTLEGAAGAKPAVEVARERFERLLTALRLADAGDFALGPIAWARVDAGPWQLASIGTGAGAHASSEHYRVAPEEEDELRGFCNLVGRRIESHARGELAWALSRFEAGRERPDRFGALTDYLLALRALLEPEGPSSGRLAQRLSAICAVPEERAVLAERTAHAISLERAVVAGIDLAEADAGELVDDVAHHLRSLLRDVLCGHLDPDLVKIADQILADAITGETPRIEERAEEQTDELLDEDELEDWPTRVSATRA
jgi:hypothetical protein